MYYCVGREYVLLRWYGICSIVRVRYYCDGWEYVLLRGYGICSIVSHDCENVNYYEDTEYVQSAKERHNPMFSLNLYLYNILI